MMIVDLEDSVDLYPRSFNVKLCDETTKTTFGLKFKGLLIWYSVLCPRDM